MGAKCRRDFFIIHRFGLSSGVQTLIIYVSIVRCDDHQLRRMFESENETATNNRIIQTIWKSITCQKYHSKKKDHRPEWMLGGYFPNVIESAKSIHAFNRKKVHSKISLMPISNWQILNDLFVFIGTHTHTPSAAHAAVSWRNGWSIVQKGSRLKFSDILIPTSHTHTHAQRAIKLNL